MDERILTGKICFPAGTVPSLQDETIIQVKYNTDPNVGDNLIVYLDDVLTYGDDSDWSEGGEG